jgi:hypothetical protein
VAPGDIGMAWMDTISLAVLAFLALLVFLTGIGSIPILVFVFKPDAMSYSFDDSFAGQELISKSDALQDWVRRLQELGFFLLGVKVEKLPLWGQAYREVALVSREGETYASILLHGDGKPASLYFYTPFKDGGMVFTRNHEFAPQMESERVSVRNVPRNDFNEILESHLSRLRIFKERGSRPLAGQSQQARIEATRAFYASEYARRQGHYLYSPSTMGFGVSLVLLFYAACRFAFSLR